jgi:small subunit ribosomal protein S6
MYEISFVLKEEDASPVKKIFSGHGAEIGSEEELRKIQLAYPMKKKEYGFFGSFRFEAGAEELKKIFSDLKLADGVLRYMVVRREEKKEESRERSRVSQPAVYKKTEELKRHPEPALTNEELEKKIEEILQ